MLRRRRLSALFNPIRLRKVVGQFEKVARASARGITRKMRVPPQTDHLKLTHYPPQTIMDDYARIVLFSGRLSATVLGDSRALLVLPLV